MTAGPSQTHLQVFLDSPDETARLAAQFADLAKPGMTLLLEGPVGAGKTFFARALIQSLMARSGQIEDVPSPTFTLVQTYEFDDFDVWHADLYRLTSPDELIELGLEAAFEDALCLIEWPEQLAEMVGQAAIRLKFEPAEDPETRHCHITGPANIVDALRAGQAS